MLRPLNKTEVVDRSSCSWYTDDGTFRITFRYLPGEIRVDLRSGSLNLTNVSQKCIKVENANVRVHDVVLAPWQEEAFLHLTLQAFASPYIEHCVQRIRFPPRGQLSGTDHTATVQTKGDQSWLPLISFSQKSRKFLLPFMDENRAANLLANQFSNRPVYAFPEDAAIMACGYMKGEEWWVAARVFTPKGRRFVVQAAGQSRFYLPESWPSDGRIRVLDDGTIQASKMAYGDVWQRVGAF